MKADPYKAKRTPRPLDRASLRALALHYVGRYATTRHRLKQYLGRKIRERGWQDEDGAPDPEGLAEEFGQLRYVDDEGFASTRASALVRRGYGPARIRASLRGAGIESAHAEHCAAIGESESFAAALALARRKRMGPFDASDAGRKARQRAYAALIRAGHDHEIAQKVLTALNAGSEIA